MERAAKKISQRTSHDHAGGARRARSPLWWGAAGCLVVTACAGIYLVGRRAEAPSRPTPADTEPSTEAPTTEDRPSRPAATWQRAAPPSFARTPEPESAPAAPHAGGPTVGFHPTPAHPPSVASTERRLEELKNRARANRVVTAAEVEEGIAAVRSLGSQLTAEEVLQREARFTRELSALSRGFEADRSASNR